MTHKVIVVDGEVVGVVATFERGPETHVTYWVKRSHWGRGHATRALRLLLAVVDTRPLIASAWAGNAGSLRVLEKCGFVRLRQATAFAAARGEDVIEVFFELCAGRA